ncbi:MAG: phage terminase large subunit, partial [Pseudomonadota bacterium]
SADPDYTVGLKGKRISDGQFFITNMERGRWSPGRVATTVKNTATQDGRVCNIRMAQDPGQAGKQQAAFYMTYLAGWPLNIVPVAGSGDKEARARPAAAQAEFGFINIVRGDWNEEFFNEVCSFPASRHDDITDALSDLIDELSNHSTFSYDNVM